MTTPPIQPLNLDLCHFQARCKVVRKLGIGAFAEVYEVVFDKQPAALKVLLPAKHTVEGTAMFKKEAVVLRDCRHRNIVRFKSLLQVPPGVRGISGSAARWAMLIELVKGESAATLLTKQLQSPYRRLYTQNRAVKWCRDVGAALLYLHNNGIMHRDVKPANVLLSHISSDGATAKLTDLGVHRMVETLLGSSELVVNVQLKSLESTFSYSDLNSDLDMEFNLESEDTGLTEHDSLQRDALLACLNPEPGRILEVQDIRAQTLEVQGISVQVLEVQGRSVQTSKFTVDSSLAAPGPACWVSSAEAHESVQPQRVMSQLTGCTGSCMYMAPEVYRCQPYNEKADVFSFGVMMYEILGRTLNFLYTIEGSEMYCKRVCEGFRPSQLSCIPPALWPLITSCWDAEPLNRPDMDWVVAQLQAWLDQDNALMEQDVPKCHGCTVS